MNKKIGISLYPGLFNTRNDIQNAIKQASAIKASTVFTSLHIPEVNVSEMISDCEFLCSTAREYEMEVIADISPRTFSNFKATPFDMESLYRIGLSGVRADFGFSKDEMQAMISNNVGLKIVINADASRWHLEEIADIAKSRGITVEACHNFYPRRDSGLSMSFVAERSGYLKGMGFEVSAFVASQDSRRAVVYEGLSTVEDHRSLTPSKAARELFSTGVIDKVFIGDPLPSRKELDELKLALEEDCLEIELELLTNVSESELDAVLGGVHLQPPESGYAHVIRSSETRKRERRIFPRNTLERPLGTVTLDNSNYGRYEGELQICLVDLPADPRVNVVGRIVSRDIRIIDLIKYSGRFKFISGSQ